MDKLPEITISIVEMKHLLVGLSLAAASYEAEFLLSAVKWIPLSFVGQGFVDQIFRVYATEHHNTTIKYIHANKDVDFMIRRGIATGKKQN